ncbi:MAG: helix-turn-helix transcriptional regulator [Phaeodactylibacter sp.]|nr:helix-turn-helix transcriptional regulator [Phaeodactylibacter sp.]MCB9052751.1 helix-turn-helix transcriptional regulator [Lewinellaceae bacterium]
MLLFLSMAGVFLSILLVYFNARKFPSVIYLGAYFFLISLYGFVTYSLLYSKSAWLASLAYIHFSFLAYLIGPLLFFYVRSLLADHSRLSPGDYWHFVPMVLFLAAILPYLVAPWPIKTDYGAQIAADPNILGRLEPTAAHRLLSTRVVLLSQTVFIAGYALWSASNLLHYVWKKRGLAVFTQQRFMLKWLTALLGFSLILVISQTLLIFETFILSDTILYFTLNGLQALSVIGLVGLLVSPFFFPNILYGLPRTPAPPAKKGTQHHHQEFETSYLDSIGQKADACMATSKPYLQTGFSMAHLAVLLDLPEHHLAYYFREERKQSFTDYRNNWRVEHAKKLIEEGKAQELTLEAIGRLCGFGSRNTFILSFKKVEGISPSTYVARLPV